MKLYRSALIVIFLLVSFASLSSKSIADTVYHLPTGDEIKENWNLQYQIDTLASNSECEKNYQDQCHAYHSNIGINKEGYHWASSDLTGGEPLWWARVAVDQYHPTNKPLPPKTPTGFTIQNVHIFRYGIMALYTISPPSSDNSYYTPFLDVAPQIMFWANCPIVPGCQWDGNLTVTCPSAPPPSSSHHK